MNFKLGDIILITEGAIPERLELQKECIHIVTGINAGRFKIDIEDEWIKYDSELQLKIGDLAVSSYDYNNYAAFEIRDTNGQYRCGYPTDIKIMECLFNPNTAFNFFLEFLSWLPKRDIGEMIEAGKDMNQSNESMEVKNV